MGETALRQSTMARRGAIWALLVLVGACSVEPAVQSSLPRERPGWQILRYIKLAAFSASDPREYDVMVFCDEDHVRLYHLAPPDEPSAELELRSGAAGVALAGERELVRATPPPDAKQETDVTGVRISARLERISPVWRAFMRTGALEVRSGAHVTDATATAGERTALVSLFAEC